MVIDLSNIVEELLAVNIRSLIISAIKSNERQIVDLNRRQLYAGNDAEGNEITPEYHPITRMFKEADGKPFDRVTLNDTGDFYESIFLNPFANGYSFEATDWKTEKLTDKYGDAILGIAENDLDEAAEIVKPTLIDLYENELRR